MFFYSWSQHGSLSNTTRTKLRLSSQSRSIFFRKCNEEPPIFFVNYEEPQIFFVNYEGPQFFFVPYEDSQNFFRKITKWPKFFFVIAGPIFVIYEKKTVPTLPNNKLKCERRPFLKSGAIS